MEPRDASPKTNDCLFCKIAAHEVDASIVFEDLHSMAFLDTRPLFPGHSLLIPKAHYETLADLPEELVNSLFRDAQRLAKVMQQAMDAEGTFVAMNNIVSQSVPHFHVHIVPRRRKDGLRGFFWPRRKYENDDQQRTVRDNLVAAWNREMIGMKSAKGQKS